MVTLEEFRELERAVSRARGVREEPRVMKPADLRRYSARALKKDVAALNAQGDKVMAARSAMGMETW